MMLYKLSAGSSGPYAWCAKVSLYERIDLPDGGIDLRKYEAPFSASFSGGRSWPDAAGNGGGFPRYMFSEEAMDLLTKFDANGKISNPIKVDFVPSKSLSRTGPPVYRTFVPTVVVPRAELSEEASLPAIFRVEGQGELLGCKEELKSEVEGSKLRNLEFVPLISHIDYWEKAAKERRERIRKANEN
jgi:hypothetical protein